MEHATTLVRLYKEVQAEPINDFCAQTMLTVSIIISFISSSIFSVSWSLGILHHVLVRIWLWIKLHYICCIWLHVLTSVYIWYINQTPNILWRHSAILNYVNAESTFDHFAMTKVFVAFSFNSVEYRCTTQKFEDLSNSRG